MSRPLPASPLLQPLRVPRRRLLVAVLWAAFWGMLIDVNRIPILSPTGNSTVWQATTAAAFAILGILGGPVIGGLGGLLRDGTFAVAGVSAHPHLVTPNWVGHAVVDILEDVVLGAVPGFAALRTRSMDVLVTVSAVTAWLSLPCLIVADTLIDGRPDRILHNLVTVTGNWDQPADPGLGVYALLTGAIVAFALARWTHPVRQVVRIGAILAIAAAILVVLGAHP